MTRKPASTTGLVPDGKESDSWAERCGQSLAAKSRPHVGVAVRRQGFLADPQA